jgi:hypothetical protein
MPQGVGEVVRFPGQAPGPNNYLGSEQGRSVLGPRLGTVAATSAAAITSPPATYEVPTVVEDKYTDVSHEHHKNPVGVTRS